MITSRYNDVMRVSEFLNLLVVLDSGRYVCMTMHDMNSFNDSCRSYCIAYVSRSVIKTSGLNSVLRYCVDENGRMRGDLVNMMWLSRLKFNLQKVEKSPLS